MSNPFKFTPKRQCGGGRRARAAQEAKFAGQDAKRRRMREKLERDEKCTTSARSEEQTARDRLQVWKFNQSLEA